MRNRIYAYAIKYEGNYSQIKKAIEQDEEYEVINCNELFITIYDKEYPTCFLQDFPCSFFMCFTILILGSDFGNFLFKMSYNK